MTSLVFGNHSATQLRLQGRNVVLDGLEAHSGRCRATSDVHRSSFGELCALHGKAKTFLHSPRLSRVFFSSRRRICDKVVNNNISKLTALFTASSRDKCCVILGLPQRSLLAKTETSFCLKWGRIREACGISILCPFFCKSNCNFNWTLDLNILF